MRGDSEERIKQKFEDFIRMIKGETDNWSEAGSGWVAGDKDLAYIEVARYNPLQGGTYLPLPASLAKKKAIINVRNKDQKCLQWAIKAAIISSCKGPAKTKEISRGGRHRLHRNRIPNANKANRQAKSAK